MTIGTTQDPGKLRLGFDAITTMTLWMVCLLDWKVPAFLFHAKCTWPNTAATGYKCRTREWAHGINHAENTMSPLLLLLVYVLVHYKTGGKQSSSVISKPKTIRRLMQLYPAIYARQEQRHRRIARVCACLFPTSKIEAMLDQAITGIAQSIPSLWYWLRFAYATIWLTFYMFAYNLKLSMRTSPHRTQYVRNLIFQNSATAACSFFKHLKWNVNEARMTEGYYGILSALRRSGPVSFVAQTHPIDMPTSLPPVIELELQSQAQLPEVIPPLPEGPDANRRGHDPSVSSGRDANRRGRGPSGGRSITGLTHCGLERVEHVYSTKI